MSRPSSPEDVKLIMSLFSKDRALINEALEALSATYGEADFISPFLDFAYTDYYAKEMGPGLVRRFVSFAPLMPPEALPDVKRETNALEERFSEDGKRRLNIDPGYLAQSHLILATGKGYSHRPYLRDGIYADLTLIYQHGSFQALPWTYPDYGSPEVMSMLIKIRNTYLEQLKAMRK
jgi:hypothetical protein